MSIEIDHLGIAVRSLEEGLNFYYDLLGMPAANRETVATERVHVAMLPTCTNPQRPRIELLEAADADSVIA
jgi:methylmalonyl-CoA/ethylmalonyl-CoA epimerase